MLPDSILVTYTTDESSLYSSSTVSSKTTYTPALSSRVNTTSSSSPNSTNTSNDSSKQPNKNGFHYFAYFLIIIGVISFIISCVIYGIDPDTVYATGRYGTGIVHHSNPYFPWFRYIGILAAVSGFFLLVCAPNIRKNKKNDGIAQGDKGLSASKQSRQNSNISDLENKSTTLQGIDLIQKEISSSETEIKRTQKYEQYLEKYPLKREEEKTRSELKKVQNKISEIQTKTWEQGVVSVLKRIFGVILIFGGIILASMTNSYEKDPFNIIYVVLISVPGIFVFLSTFMPPKRLRTLRKEEKALLTTIKEIEKLPPFTEDDEKRKDVEAKAEAERLESERQTKKATKKRIRTITIATLIVVACIAFVIVMTTVIIPKQKYNAAVEKYGQEYVDAFYSLNVGDVYKFGSYEQDNNTENGTEDIEWIVLEKKGNKILVISKYVLDYQQYAMPTDDNGIGWSTTWETSLLRQWLNGSFLNTAFSESERNMISTVTVSADLNPWYDTNPGNTTTDKVFLLSSKEANMYFSSDSARRCKGTVYCDAQGAYIAPDGYCSWYLRTPCKYLYSIAFVGSSGKVDNYGTRVVHEDIIYYNKYNFSKINVRPAMWIEL